MVLLLSAFLHAAPPATSPARTFFEQGQALAARHDHAAAIAKYDQSLAQDPNQADVHAYKSASLVALNQLPQAQTEISTALKLDPKDFRFPEIQGQIELTQGHIDQAKVCYDKAIAIAPHQAGAIYLDWAAALAARNDPALAAKIDAALKSAAAADPPSVEALFQLGQSYANAGKPEGKTYLQKYVEQSAKLPEAQRDAQKIQIAKQLIRALDILNDAGK